MNRKKRILVVEDDKSISRGLKDLLQSEDYAVSVVIDGREAVRQVSKIRPDLVLLDLNLPDIAGLEVCRQIRAAGFTNPVIMLTARGEQVDKIVGLEAGADDYITKPFDARELVTRVRAQLREMDRMPVSTRQQRRLLAVMFTDIKDFAKMMNRDETLALKLLKIHNSKIQKAVRRAGGRVIEVIGDAFLVVFQSALKAVECGVLIQRDLREYDLRTSKDGQIRIRIGIHLGDVIEVEGKLRGDTINIAARLQQIAAPGHINVSESVYETIKGRMKIRTVNLGSRRVKNIKQPISVYRLSV